MSNRVRALLDEVLRLAPNVMLGYQLRCCASTLRMADCKRYSAARKSGRLASTEMGTSRFTPLAGNKVYCAGSAAMASPGLRLSRLRRVSSSVLRLFCREIRLLRAESSDWLDWVGSLASTLP